MPLEDSGGTGDDLVTNQETITTSMDQPSLSIPQPREAPSRTPGRGTRITAPQQPQVSMTNTFAVPNIHGLAPGSALPASGDTAVTPEDFLGDPGGTIGAPPLTSAGPRLDHLMKIQPTQKWLADIVGGTINANTPMPGGVPPLASKKHKEAPIPRQVSQHHQLFEDIYQQVTPTDRGYGSTCKSQSGRGVQKSIHPRQDSPRDCNQHVSGNNRTRLCSKHPG